jgi:hypothetical protein
MPKRPARLLILFAVLVVVLAVDYVYRHWRPDVTVTTEHYAVYSTATLSQTREIADKVEALYEAYTGLCSGFGDVKTEHPRLQLRLFRDRKEFRRCNRLVGWAEAFYRKPYCYAYYSRAEANPYHWMLHEATHQLMREVSNLDPLQWVDEGVATYFSTSTLSEGGLVRGEVDKNTYPIWWLWDKRFSEEVKKDIEAGTIIPLRVIVSGKGGPDIDEYFNLYYLHWWSLTHFLLHYERGKYRQGYFQVIRAGGTLGAFESHIGPVERVQGEWYGYLREQQQGLSRKAGVLRGAPGG